MLHFSICHTTRAPRKKEENLEDYCFVTQEEFERGVVMVSIDSRRCFFLSLRSHRVMAGKMRVLIV